MKRAILVCGALVVLFSVMVFSVSEVNAQPRRGRGLPEFSEMEKAPIPKDENEKKTLAVLDDIYQNQSYANVPESDGRFLRLLTECTDAKQVVEIGTSTGISGIWFGMALQKNDGKLTTFEIDAERAKIARENFKRVGMDSFITLIEGDAHKECTKLKEPIDILFLDADKEGYIDYLEKLLPLVRPGGLVIAHNINTRMADPKFVERITNDPKLETLIRMGMSFSMKKK